MSRKKWNDEKLFIRLQNNKSDKTYWENIRELRSRANENIFKTCIKLSKSVNSKDRTIAVDILAQLGIPPRPFYKESKKVFFNILQKESDKDVLFSVLYAIGHNNEKLTSQEISKICSFQNSKDVDIRKSLVYALLSVDNKLAIDTLIHLTADPISYIRDWATFGIGQQIERDNKNIRQALWLRTQDKDRYVKFEAIFGLAKRKDIRVKENIKRELLAFEYETLLFEAIAELKDTDFLPLLKQNLKKANLDKEKNAEWIKELKVCVKQLSKV